MSEFWGYSYKDGWVSEYDFIEREIALSGESDLDVVIKSLGYKDGSGIYQIDDSTLGNPIEVYEQSADKKLPKYLVQFSPTGGDITYFVARNMPSLIELLGKLTPLVQANVISSFVDDINHEKYRKQK